MFAYVYLTPFLPGVSRVAVNGNCLIHSATALRKHREPLAIFTSAIFFSTSPLAIRLFPVLEPAPFYESRPIRLIILLDGKDFVVSAHWLSVPSVTLPLVRMYIYSDDVSRNVTGRWIELPGLSISTKGYSLVC